MIYSMAAHIRGSLRCSWLPIAAPAGSMICFGKHPCSSLRDRWYSMAARAVAFETSCSHLHLIGLSAEHPSRCRGLSDCHYSSSPALLQEERCNCPELIKPCLHFCIMLATVFSKMILLKSPITDEKENPNLEIISKAHLNP